MMYKPYWNSLKKHATPDWLKESKFGIYTHWGVYSVPACGPNGTWYPFSMYREGSSQYKYHVKNYGNPSKFGYKDFIPKFTGEKFDAEEWAELFKKSGAKFAGPVGEHHDGFAMWDSKFTEWNAKEMGPKRDVVGELETAIKNQDMRFMVALHHAENWFFFPHWIKKYDTFNPEYSKLYGPKHNEDWINNIPKSAEKAVFGHDEVPKYFLQQEQPNKEFLDLWLNKTKEVIDKYRPDLLWFDFGLRFVQEHYKKEFLAYYYNKSIEWNNEVAVAYKWHDLAAGSGLIDLELGRFNELTYNDWITDTTVDDGQGWCYIKNTKYKTPESLVHYLIDNVSKNGYMLLNVGPKPNGEIPEPAKNILLEIGKWLEVNGEAIYGTTPWMAYGEGPTKMKKAGMFSEDDEVTYTAEDIRFTVKDDNLYAITLGCPEKEVNIKKFAEKLYESEIESIKMLGVKGELKWNMSEDGLKIKLPDQKPCDYALALKINRKHPFKK